MIQNLIFGILLLKMLFPTYNFLIIIHLFQWTLSEFFFQFQIFWQKVSKPTKTIEKNHLFCNTISLKKPCSFMNLNSLEIENNMLPQHSQNSFWFYHRFFGKHVSVWCQKKPFPLRHFWSTSKANFCIFLYILVYLIIKIFVPKT